MKRCTQCGMLKDEAEFWRVRKNGIALRGRCIACCSGDPRDHSEDAKPLGKVCTVCKEWKPLSAFHKHRICLYGVESLCKQCKFRKRKERDAQNPGRIRNMDLKAKYGITLDDYNAMYERQGGRCAICGAAEGKLVVDHNHKTGKVRELLCHLCNAMIGCAREDLAIIAAAAAYLYREQHPERDDVRATISFS